jgi:hypothetical protein
MTNQFSDRCTGPGASHKLGSDFEGWYFDKILRLLIGTEQRLHFAAHAFIIVASLVKKCCPLLGCAFDR